MSLANQQAEPCTEQYLDFELKNAFSYDHTRRLKGMRSPLSPVCSLRNPQLFAPRVEFTLYLATIATFL
jgi:hypothetical protein